MLVSEDFAKFTAGSEDDPDGTELSDWNDGTIDAKYTQQPGWRGGFVYQAGGCAYLDVDTEEGTGWLIPLPSTCRTTAVRSPSNSARV